MKSIFKYSVIFLAVLCIGILHSCKKDKDFPDEPIIRFEKLVKFQGQNGKDTLSVVTISFTDGDGDLGLREADSLPPYDTLPYSSNFFVGYFERINGTFQEIILPFPISARIPYLTPAGKNKAIEGEIDMDIQLKPGAVNDTIRYEIFIVDRALRKSNTITTTELIINTQ